MVVPNLLKDMIITPKHIHTTDETEEISPNDDDAVPVRTNEHQIVTAEAKVQTDEVN